MKSILEIDGLTYKGVLKEISLSLEEGKSYLLFGSNNSGKTTLIDCIRGILDFQGTITIQNNNIKQANNSFLYKDVGFCVEQKIFFEKNVFDELKTILFSYGYDEDRATKKIFSILKKLDIMFILFKEQNDLTLYEQKILSFIISILHDPKIIIIDDFFDTLDNKFKIKILEYLKQLKNKTILLLSNNTKYYYLADEYFFLQNSKLLKFSSINDLVSNEKKIMKQGIKLPFSLDLSNKLISYGLIDEIEISMEEMVKKIWN